MAAMMQDIFFAAEAYCGKVEYMCISLNLDKFIDNVIDKFIDRFICCETVT
jgi:hypothetical protein